jgi:disulfide bond formation protein DsbB
MSNLKIETYLKLIFIISLISVFSAYFIQYILGHQPCNLCLLERIPYILSIILIVINYIFKKNEKFFILLLIIVFIFSFTISVYHFGIEQGIFEESLICSIENNSTIISKEELLLELQRNSMSCKDVTFRIFGLSLTSINIIISLIILSFLTKIFIFYEKIR